MGEINLNIVGICIQGIAIIGLIIILHIERKASKKERDELLGRIMAKDFTEFAVGSKIIKEADTKKPEPEIDEELDAYTQAEMERQKQIRNGERIVVS